MYGKNLFRSFINFGEVLDKLRPKGFLASSLSTSDFSTFYITLSHYLRKIIDLVERTFSHGAHFL